jgi:hypothetical protein
MFGVLLSNELNKVAECAGPKKKGPVMKTDVMKKIAQLIGDPKPTKGLEPPVAPTPPPMPDPDKVTPPGGYPAKPITPTETEAPSQFQARSHFNPGYNKMASQESTMNMFGVLVNMELQKIAQEGGFTAGRPLPGDSDYIPPVEVPKDKLRALGEKFRKKQPVKQ